MDQPQIQPNINPLVTKPTPPYFFLSIIFFVAGLILFVYSFKMNQFGGPDYERITTDSPAPTQSQVQKKENSTSLQATSNPPDSAASNSVALTTVTEMPPGYKVKDTICYRMYVPNTSVLGEDNKCNMYFSTNQAFPLSLKVSSEYLDSSDKSSSLIDFTSKRIIMGEVVKDEGLTVDGLPAQLIVEKTHPTNGDEMYRLFVDVSSKQFEVNGYPIGALEFSSVIVNGGDREEELNTFNTIVGSLSWK